MSTSSEPSKKRIPPTLNDLPYDALEIMLEKLDVFSQQRCKWMSKQWKNSITTIETANGMLMSTPYNLPPSLCGAKGLLEGNNLFVVKEQHSEKVFEIEVPSLIGTSRFIGGGEGYVIARLGRNVGVNYATINPLTKHQLSLARHYTLPGSLPGSCSDIILCHFSRVIVGRPPTDPQGFFFIGMGGLMDTTGIFYLRQMDATWKVIQPPSTKREFNAEECRDAQMVGTRIYVLTSLGNLYCSDLLQNGEMGESVIVCTGDDPSDATKSLHFSQCQLTFGRLSDVRITFSHYLINGEEPASFIMVTREQTIFQITKELVRDRVEVFTCRPTSGHLPTWERVFDIGNLCIFLGQSNSLAVPTDSRLGLNRNFIYFANHEISNPQVTAYSIVEQSFENRLSEPPTIPFPVWLKPSFRRQ